MEKSNKYIEDYLDYYCGIKDPEYAILIKGPWGCGKTWFINEQIKKIEKKKRKKIYVSLYGINSTSEIEDIFFQELHPYLSSKGVAIAGKIVKGFLKTAVKIDLDGNGGSSDLSVVSQIPDFKIPDYLKNTKDCILIFDDLERCVLDIEIVLGYINFFVEHQGLKVIIIANEDEILERESAKKQELYKKIKEKLIGKTFKIEPDFDSALSVIIKGISKPKIREFLKKNIVIIKDLYFLSGYENLRHLKQSISDFERFFGFIPGKATKISDLMSSLLKYFLIFSFEIRHGKIIPSEIPKLKEESIYRFARDEREKNIYMEILDKYGVLDLYDILLTDKCWMDFFDRGAVNENAINESLSNSSYYQNRNTPDWVKLWHHRNLEDKQFNNVLETVVKNYKGRKYKKLGIIKHVFGLLLYLSEAGLYGEKKKDIVNEFKRYVDFLKEKALLLDEKKAVSSFNDDAYNGLQFFSIEKNDFKKAVQYADKIIEESKIENMPDAGQKLLVLMKTDIDKFYRAICLCNSDDQVYYRIPIFKYIDPKNFVDHFLDLKQPERRHVILALNERYKYDDINDILKEELGWLEGINKQIREVFKKNPGRLSSYLLRAASVNYLDKIIGRMKEKKRKQAKTE